MIFESIPELFAGEPDHCERLVGALQYCAFIPTNNTFSNAVVVTLLEKGVLYRQMIDLSDLAFLDRCYYVHNKFTEFHDKLIVVDAEVSIAKETISELLFTVLSRVKSTFETQNAKMRHLKVFQLVLIYDVLFVFEISRESSNFAATTCKVVALGSSGYVMDLRWTQIAECCDALQEILTKETKIMDPSLQPFAAIVSVIREASEEEADQDFDDEIVAFNDYLHVCKKEEATGSIFALRKSIEDIYHNLAQRAEHNHPTAPTYLQHQRSPAQVPTQSAVQARPSSSRPSTASSVLPRPPDSDLYDSDLSASLRRHQDPLPTHTNDIDPSLGESLSNTMIIRPGAIPSVVSTLSGGKTRNAANTPPPVAPDTGDLGSSGVSRAEQLLLQQHQQQHHRTEPLSSNAFGTSTVALDTQTVFQHELWGRGATRGDTGSTQFSHEDVFGEPRSLRHHVDDVRLQSLSEFRPPTAPVRASAAVTLAGHAEADDEDDLSHIHPHHQRDEDNDRRTLDDLIRDTADHESVSHSVGHSRPTTATATHGATASPSVRSRPASAIPKDSALASSTSSTAWAPHNADDVHPHDDGGDSMAVPAVSVSPVRRPPTAATAAADLDADTRRSSARSRPPTAHSATRPAPASSSHVPHTETQPQPRSEVSASLHAELLASHEHDDSPASYALRAYQAIRSRAVEQAEYDDLLSRPGTAASSALSASVAGGVAGLRGSTAPDAHDVRGSVRIQTPPRPSTAASVSASASGAGAAKLTATPPSAQSLNKSANHESFDDFFGDTSSASSAASAVGEEEETGGMRAGAAGLMDDLMSDLDIRTPGQSTELPSSAQTLGRHDPVHSHTGKSEKDRPPSSGVSRPPTAPSSSTSHAYPQLHDASASKPRATSPSKSPSSSSAVVGLGNPDTQMLGKPQSRPSSSQAHPPSSSSSATSAAASFKLRSCLERISQAAGDIMRSERMKQREQNMRRLRLGRRALQIMHESDNVIFDDNNSFFPNNNNNNGRFSYDAGDGPSGGLGVDLGLGRTRSGSPSRRPDSGHPEQYASVAAALRPDSVLDIDIHTSNNHNQNQNNHNNARNAGQYNGNNNNSNSNSPNSKLSIATNFNNNNANNNGSNAVSSSRPVSGSGSVPGSGASRVQRTLQSELDKHAAPSQVINNNNSRMPTGNNNMMPADRGSQPPADRVAPSQPSHTSPQQVLPQQVPSQRPTAVAWDLALSPAAPGAQRGGARGSALPTRPRSRRTSAAESEAMHEEAPAPAPNTEEVQLGGAGAVRPRSRSAQRAQVVKDNNNNNNNNSSNNNNSNINNSNVGGGGREKSHSRLSNYVQTRNAVQYVCLAGGHQEERRAEVLELLDYYSINGSAAGGAGGAGGALLQGVSAADFLVCEEMRGTVSQFVVMFYKAKTLSFKGLYVLDPRSRQLVRVFGRGPARLPSEGEIEHVQEYLKFETSSKSFKPLPVRSLTSTVDGMILEPPRANSAHSARHKS